MPSLRIHNAALNAGVSDQKVAPALDTIAAALGGRDDKGDLAGETAISTAAIAFSRTELNSEERIKS
jgi:hypothetical protein